MNLAGIFTSFFGAGKTKVTFYSSCSTATRGKTDFGNRVAAKTNSAATACHYDHDLRIEVKTEFPATKNDFTATAWIGLRPSFCAEVFSRSAMGAGGSATADASAPEHKHKPVASGWSIAESPVPSELRGA